VLWYKAWLETRTRFLICLIGITALFAYEIYRMDSDVMSPVNAAFYNSVMNGRYGQLTFWWLLAVNLLTMGGLLREKAVGAASFTLGLPSSRARLTVVRMATTLAQAMLLLVAPWGVIFVTARVFANTPPFSQALFHLALLAGGGVLLFAVAFLVSSVIEGEYTAPLVSGGLILAIGFQVDGRSLVHYNPVAFMMGGRFYDGHSGLLVGHVPWLQIAVYGLLAACLVLASVKALELREF